MEKIGQILKQFLLSPFTLLFVFLILGSQNLHAQEFKNFTIKDSSQELSQVVFGDLNLSEESPLYREILGYLDQHHQRIAERQLRQVEEGRGLQVWGDLNHVGLRFSKGFGDFSIELKREVAPDLFDDERWLVTDTFDITIDASHVLSRLKNEEVIDISEKNLALFAGLTFKRTYTHVHFADTYEKALGFNLDKLFFTFKSFRDTQIYQLAPFEFIKKEDSFSLQAGGLASVPVTTGLAAHVGALLKYQKLAETTVQGVSPDEATYEGERLRFSSEKSKELTLGVTGGIVADFLGLLQVSLLKFDFSYSLKESYKIYLSLSQNDISEFLENEELRSRMASLLKHQKVAQSKLAPYLVSEEQRKLETSRFKYNLLLKEGLRDLKTEHISIAKDGVEHSFFRHNYERSTSVQNIFSRLFHELVKGALKVSSIINKSRYETDKVRVEYRHQRNLMQTKEDLILGNGPHLSVNFMKDYYAFKVKKQDQKKVLNFLDHFSGADPLLADQIERGLLEGSLNVQTTFSLNEDALRYFHELSVSQVYDVIDDSCKAGRTGIKGWLSGLLKICERTLKKAYDQYDKERRFQDYTGELYKSCQSDLKVYQKGKRWLSSRRKRSFLDSCLQRKSIKSLQDSLEEVPVWQLARLMRTLEKNVPSKVHHYQLFGYKNVHIHGSLSGIKKDGRLLEHHFREGIFKGLGTVSNSMKSLGLRSSANLNSL